MNPINQNYLRHCMQISLLKRWPWAAALTGVVLVACVMFNAPNVLIMTLPVLTALIVLVVIAVNSWQRHRHDPEARMTVHQASHLR